MVRLMPLLRCTTPTLRGEKVTESALKGILRELLGLDCPEADEDDDPVQVPNPVLDGDALEGDEHTTEFPREETETTPACTP